ncbi:MAG: hypothetical protein K0S01_2016 [Herbinix sp.]|jgi:hypothetical protein|nr:hypothetical protein [Herbinix sp.]
MLILNISIFLLFAIGYLYGIKNTKELIKNIDKKEHKLYILYPLAEVILTKTRLENFLNRKERITNSIKALHATNKPELLQRLYWCSRISLIMAILILFDLLSLLGQLQSTSNSIIQEGKYITRPEYGEGSDEVNLKVAMEQSSNKEGMYKDGMKESEGYSEDLTIKVEERSYSEDELSQIFEKAIQYLKLYVLGDNSSADLVYENLNFIETIPGTSIAVEWRPENYELIQIDGTIQNEQIVEKGLITTVTATLTYHNQQVEHSMSFHIMPKKYSEEEKLLNKLEDEITTSNEKSKEDRRMELPDAIENYRLKWSEKEENIGLTLLFLGALMALLAWIFGDKELDNQMTRRKEQMLLDYPEIINKFTLLVNAGMTVKQAWNKIAEDYGFKILQKESKKRFAYEEMLTTSHELRLGLPESIAYEQYGRRTGLIPYIKFSSLISQNLKKGNRGFTELLMKEAIEAFEDRKETAKRLGEEAGTKLLIPMMIMLIIVFLIILVPAFWSFGA